MQLFKSLTTENFNAELNNLHEGLSHFGLSPDDWVLIETEKDVFKIKHRTQPEFYFKGKTQYKNGRKHWGYITLAGI